MLQQHARTSEFASPSFALLLTLLFVSVHAWNDRRWDCLKISPQAEGIVIPGARLAFHRFVLFPLPYHFFLVGTRSGTASSK
jgi:hypothetical protein